MVQPSNYMYVLCSLKLSAQEVSLEHYLMEYLSVAVHHCSMLVLHAQTQAQRRA